MPEYATITAHATITDVEYRHPVMHLGRFVGLLAFSLFVGIISAGVTYALFRHLGAAAGVLAIFTVVVTAHGLVDGRPMHSDCGHVTMRTLLPEQLRPYLTWRDAYRCIWLCTPAKKVDTLVAKATAQAQVAYDQYAANRVRRGTFIAAHRQARTPSSAHPPARRCR